MPPWTCPLRCRRRWRDRADRALCAERRLWQFAAQFGLRIAYTQWGILLALIFVGLPCHRTVQPVIAEIDREVEASATLGPRGFIPSSMSSCRCWRRRR